MPATKEAVFAFEKEKEVHGELHLRRSDSILSQSILSRKDDPYLPGSPDYMAKAIERNAVNPDSVWETAYRIPPIIGPRSSPKSIKGLENLGREGMRLAIANLYFGKGFLNLPFLQMESLENKKRYRKLFPLFGFRYTSILGEPPYFG
jgi:hypothetical protein